jgi:S-DNA-T family DNA segregation ATPase FtsK/SpoIIIE
MIQRKLQVGYARAGRIIDELEERGLISGPNGSKPRQILVDEADYRRG